jgi:uroporphyrinogen III methyltransferase/synthase
VVCYRTDYVSAPQLRQALDAGELECAVFTSASTVRGFAAAVGEGADLSKLTGLCIGPKTAQAARDLGIPVRVAREATIEGLIELAQEQN